MIISLILTTFSLDFIVILLEENWLWSLLRLKGLRDCTTEYMPQLFFRIRNTPEILLLMNLACFNRLVQY